MDRNNGLTVIERISMAGERFLHGCIVPQCVCYRFSIEGRKLEKSRGKLQLWMPNTFKLSTLFLRVQLFLTRCLPDDRAAPLNHLCNLCLCLSVPLLPPPPPLSLSLSLSRSPSLSLPLSLTCLSTGFVCLFVWFLYVLVNN